MHRFVVLSCLLPGLLLVAIVGVAAVGTAATAAGDESKKEEAWLPVVEPKYESEPRYGLLVFGEKAEHRIWVVFDGDVVYIDRNANGDLMDSGERVEAPPFEGSPSPFALRERRVVLGSVEVDGRTHHGLEIVQSVYRRVIGPLGRQEDEREFFQSVIDEYHREGVGGVGYLVVVGLDSSCYGFGQEPGKKRLAHTAFRDADGPLVFAKCAVDAPRLRFGGPLEARLGAGVQLARGRESEVRVFLGNAGSGPGSFVQMGYGLVPPGAHPVIEITYPAVGLQKSVKHRAKLMRRC